MAKLTDLNIEDRAWPLIVHADNSDILHISRSNGERKEDGKGHYLVTDCGRALSWANNTYKLYDGYKCCPKCGTREDFEAVLIEANRLMKEDVQRLEAKREAEMEEWRQQHAREEKALNEFWANLIANGYDTEQGDHSFFVTVFGQRFEVVPRTEQ